MRLGRRENMVFEVLIDLAMIFAPVIGYVPQSLEIKEVGSSEGFSFFVSFVLMIANILRLCFSLGREIGVVLVLQSVVMIVAQLIVLWVCVRYHPNRRLRLFNKPPATFSDFLKRFWYWDNYLSYIFCTAIIAAIAFTISMPLKQFSTYVELVGFLSLSIEATIGMPQAFKNFSNASTEGFSVFLVLTWIFGDAFKTIYFLINSSPVQFVMCGFIQVFVDIVLVLQIFWYHGKSPKQTSLPGGLMQTKL